MSLGRLLATGKSLVGGRENTGRYRVDKRMALPKFISPRNPFAPAAKAGPSPADVACAQVRREAATVTAKTGKAVVEEKVRQVSAGARAARWLGEWGQKLNPWPRLRKPPGPVKSAAPFSSKAAVQPELSLDKVQVVRSDLSDADLEVVPMKAKLPVAKGPAESTGKYELAESAWDRVTARIFGAGSS